MFMEVKMRKSCDSENYSKIQSFAIETSKFEV